MNVDCVQCGGKVAITDSSEFVRCGFCDTALYVDLSGTIRNVLIRPEIDAGDVPGLLDRHLQRMEVRGARVSAATLRYVPFWEIGGRIWHVAVSVTDTELFRVGRVSGKREFLTPERAADLDVPAPDVPLDEAAGTEMDAGDKPDASLVYLPMYRVDYTHGDANHQAWVDAVSGTVFEDDPPPAATLKLDRRFGGFLAVAVAIFLAEGLVLGAGWGLVAIAASAVGLAFVMGAVLRG